jgi:hypothetical protein
VANVFTTLQLCNDDVRASPVLTFRHKCFQKNLPLELAAGISFVNAHGVTIGIEIHRHAANRRLQRLNAKLHIVPLQMRDESVKIFYFKAGTAAVRIRFKSRVSTALNVLSSLYFATLRLNIKAGLGERTACVLFMAAKSQTLALAGVPDGDERRSA